MKPDIVHSAAVSLAALALPLLAGCGGQDEPLPSDAPEVALCLNIEQLGNARSTLDELTDNEKMRTVRVILLHADGTVEHNRHYALEGAGTSKSVILKVKSGETKKIFLFANEESVEAVEGVTAAGGTQSLTGFFESYPEGTGGFEAEVNSLYFAPAYTASDSDGSFLPIPMSSMYEITVPENGNYNATFYVVRVATKFVVEFVSWRGTDTTVKYIALKTHAEKNFLMAKVLDTESNRTLFSGYENWIEWLKVVSDNSPKWGNEVTDWLTDYGMPTGETSQTTYRSTEYVDVPKATTNEEGIVVSGKAEHIFYLPESKNLDAATGSIQEYLMTICLDDGLNEGEVEIPLTGLNALFRNTEVIITIELSDHTIAAEVDVIPYSSVELDPVFGLPSTTNTTTP